MKRYILTGAPGSGKTAIIRWLESAGRVVVEEAATDVIALEQARGNAEPWTDLSFVDAIAELQRARQLRAAAIPCDTQFYDRSPVCTYALAVFLGHPVSPVLADELDRVTAGRVYEKRVFFLQNLGFVTPTAARRISLADALRFERIHEDAYRTFGYECVPIAAGELAVRAAEISRSLGLPGVRGERGDGGRDARP
jgi:predicted ATPase